MSKIIKVFGDSHASFFKVDENLAAFYRAWKMPGDVVVDVIPGATIRGFGKRESTLKVKDKILAKITAGDIVVLNFGQVDIELGMYYRKFVKNISEDPHEFMLECIDYYQQLLTVLLESSVFPVIKGLNVPVLIDQQIAARYTFRVLTENRSELSAEQINTTQRQIRNKLPSFFERIRYSVSFNEFLFRLAIKNGIPYFDINDDIAYPNGVIREEFIRPTKAGYDYHICDSVKARIIHIKNLKKTLDKNLMSKLVVD